MQNDDELVVRIFGATATNLAGNVLEVTIQTSRGHIQGLLHPCEGESGATIWVGGASGDMNGPAGGIYADLSRDLVDSGVTSFRLRYRSPGEHQECVLDTLASISFLKGIGATKIAVVGHSFGGAVAVAAGALNPAVTGVVALSSQRHGTNLVGNIAPRPLLLVHGDEDTVLDCAASRDIFERAKEPKELVIYPGAGHGLGESRSELETLLRKWLIDRVGIPSQHVIRPGSEARAHNFSYLVERSEGILVREIALVLGNIVDVEADALVCPTNEQLWMDEGLARTVASEGGEGIVYEAQERAPAQVGSATAVTGGRLKVKHVILAVTGETAWSNRRPDEESVLEATRNCLKKAEELGLRSIAFPALGTGGGGFAFEKAAHLMVTEVAEYLRSSTLLEKAIFVSFSSGCFRAFQEELKQLG